MGLLDRLFRKSERPLSRLDDYLARIDNRAIPALAKKENSPDFRIATAISLLVLQQSGRFARDLFADFRKSPIPHSTPVRSASGFDAAAFETAAVIHYSLLAKHLGSLRDKSDRDIDADEDADEADPYLVAVRKAHCLTGEILNSLASFSVNKKVFLNRPIAYAMRARRQGFVELFEGILLEAVKSGAPASLRPTGGPLDLDLGLTMITGLSARTFAVTTLPVFEEVVNNLIDHAAELGLE